MRIHADYCSLSAPRVLYARSCFGIPLFAGRVWLPHPFWSTHLQPPGAGGVACDNTISTARAIEPAAYVELRALEITKDEVVAEAKAAQNSGGASLVKRFWPFRWPLQVSNLGPVQPDRIPGSSPTGPGQYIDILV